MSDEEPLREDTVNKFNIIIIIFIISCFQGLLESVKFSEVPYTRIFLWFFLIDQIPRLSWRIQQLQNHVVMYGTP